MKDGMEYAEMLGLQVSSCDVIVKPKRTRKKKVVKEDAMKKIEEAPILEVNDEFETIDIDQNEPCKRKFKFDLAYAEGVAVFVLAAGILLTNIFWENSGINRLFKAAFGSSSTTAADLRTSAEFNAQTPTDQLEATLENGVMVFNGKGTLYPVCDGSVAAIEEENGKYSITLKHSDVFKTVISGVDFVYADKGDDVFKYVPVCFVNGGSARVSMYNEDKLITDYVVEDGSIVWAS